jgi:hypothetical protein
MPRGDQVWLCDVSRLQTLPDVGGIEGGATFRKVRLFLWHTRIYFNIGRSQAKPTHIGNGLPIIFFESTTLSKFLGRDLMQDPDVAWHCARLPEKIDLCKIDNFIAVPAENRFEHEEAEAGYLLKADRRRHGEFLPVHEDFDQSGSVMLHSLGDHRSNLIRSFRRQSQETSCFGNLCEVRVIKVCCEIEDANCLHFQFHKGQRVILEDNLL